MYPISLIGDLCNVDYAVQIAVLTSKYKYIQHKYNEVGLNGNSGAQKRKEKAQQQIQSSAAKFRKLTEFFAASSPRLTTI